MTAPFSIRLHETTLARLEERAALRSEAPRTMAQRYIEEGLRHDIHPQIRFADGPAGRRAALVGTGLDVWEVIATIQDNDNDLAAAADYLQVSPTLIDSSVSYYGAYRDEIDRLITANQKAARSAYDAWSAGRRAVGA